MARVCVLPTWLVQMGATMLGACLSTVASELRRLQMPAAYSVSRWRCGSSKRDMGGEFESMRMATCRVRVRCA